MGVPICFWSYLTFMNTVHEVQVIYEDHKIWPNGPFQLEIYLVNVKFMWKIKSNFVACLENLTYTIIFFFANLSILENASLKISSPNCGVVLLLAMLMSLLFFPKKIQRWAVHHLEIMEERLLELHLWLCNFNSTCNKSWHLSSAMCWAAFRHSWSKFRKGGEIKISTQSFYCKLTQTLFELKSIVAFM